MMDEKKDMLKDQEAALTASPVKAVPDSAADTVEDDDDNLIIKFKKPYKFEGKEYTELDLSALENVTGADMIKINKRLSRAGEAFTAVPELTLEYALNLAADLTQRPVEFYTGLPGRYAMQVKNRVSAFLFGAE